MSKLGCYSPDRQIVSCVSSWLEYQTQSESQWLRACVYPQASYLLSEPEGWKNRHAIQPSDGTQLRGAFSILEGRAALQRALGWRQIWVKRSLYILQKGQMPSTTCGKEEPLAIREAGDWLPGKQLCPERTWGKQSEHEPAALAAETTSSKPQEPRQNIRQSTLSPFRCGLAPPGSHMLGAPQHKKNVAKLAQRRAARQWGLEDLPCEDRLRK